MVALQIQVYQDIILLKYEKLLYILWLQNWDFIHTSCMYSLQNVWFHMTFLTNGCTSFVYPSFTSRYIVKLCTFIASLSHFHTPFWIIHIVYMNHILHFDWVTHPSCISTGSKWSKPIVIILLMQKLSHITNCISILYLNHSS